jgi:chemotaxis protein histidine kinase CheA
VNAPPSRSERIAAARDGFIKRAGADGEQVQLLLEEARNGDNQAAQRIRELAHRLAGTAGSFGFMEVTSAAAATVTVVETGTNEQELAMAVDRLCAEIMLMGRDPS